MRQNCYKTIDTGHRFYGHLSLATGSELCGIFSNNSYEEKLVIHPEKTREMNVEINLKPQTKKLAHN